MWLDLILLSLAEGPIFCYGWSNDSVGDCDKNDLLCDVLRAGSRIMSRNILACLYFEYF